MSVEQGPRPEKQKWEYRFISRDRGTAGFFGVKASSWTPSDADFETQIERLGDSGWELVSIVPRSSVGRQFSGFTTDELWVFKRPKRELSHSVSTERNIELKRFSPEAREALEQRGYIIYELSGKSIKDIRKERGSLLEEWNRTDKFEGETTKPTEVAIRPNHFFLEGSGNESFSKQQKMVDDFSRELTKNIKNVKAVVGEASQYIELGFSCWDATGEWLFQELATRTTTLSDSGDRVFVGYELGIGLRYYEYFSEGALPDVYVSPLLVPA